MRTQMQSAVAPQMASPVPRYDPQIDNFNSLEAYVRRAYNPSGDPARDRGLIIEPYSYPIEFTDILPGAVAQTGVIKIASNADFVLSSINGNVMKGASSAGTAWLNPGCLEILLTDTGSQKQMSSDFVDLYSYLGFPYYGDQGLLPYPQIIGGRSEIQVAIRSFSNLAAGTPTYGKVVINLAGVLVKVTG